MANHLRKNDDFPTVSDFFPSLFDEDSSLLDKLSPSLAKNNFKADIHETDKEYTIKIDISGFDKENISIDFDHDILTVHAKKHTETSEEHHEGQFIKKERSYGSMTRQFYLKNADNKNSKATYKDGVLTLNMPKIKDEDSSKTQIPIE